jgi:aspartyl aminopeptidase
MAGTTVNEGQILARGLLTFVDASPTPFQLVSTVSERLRAAGFVELQEIDTWAKKELIKKNGKV